MTDNQKVLLAGLLGAGAGTAQGLYNERRNAGTRLQTLLRALGYSGVAALGTSGIQSALARSGIKQAEETEKTAEIEKEAIGPLALAMLPFLAYSAYSGVKNTGRAVGDFRRGDTRSGMKNLGRAGVDALFAIPMLRGAGMAAKSLGVAARAGRAGKPVSQFSSHLPGFATAPGAGSFKQVAGNIVAAPRYGITGATNLAGRIPGSQYVAEPMISGGRALARSPLARWGDPKKFLSARNLGLLGGGFGGSMLLGVDPRDAGQPVVPPYARAGVPLAARLPHARPGVHYRYPYRGGANTLFAQPTSAPQGMQISGTVGGYSGFPLKQFHSQVR